MGLVLRYFFSVAFAITLQFFSFQLVAQRCGTVEYTHSIQLHPEKQKLRFEQWLSAKMLRQQSGRSQREQAAPYKIPVVVHVIHNGEAIGDGSNISDAQVLSQIHVLNEDFNRQNPDTENTPAEFASVAGSLDIEFVLAKQDPDGLATTGIVRVDGGENSWTMNDNYALKELSYWPAEQYLNIWVCNLTDYIGYAQFPESGLEGLEEKSSTNRLTDGVVIWYKGFGSIDDGNFALDPSFNKGRTLTHELGHFFGLLHIWGDENGCSGSDYVTDTPNQAGSSSGCPLHPKTDSCGEVIMFQNFLDYTDDTCMNLFTVGQVDRMVTVIENSPRRHSLLTSPGLLEPNPVPDDLGIRDIIFPDATVCGTLITPVIQIHNYGSNQIVSARIRLTVDGVIAETKDFSLSLIPLESVEVSFAETFLVSGEHAMTFEILLTNGRPDSQNLNDSLSLSVTVPAFVSPPFMLNFNSLPPDWIIKNPDGQITWEIATAPKNVPDNQALSLNCFDYEDKAGEIDIFLSPIIDLSSAPAATLTFDVAYARFHSSNDRLQVIALTNCQDISTGTILYDSAGAGLATAPATSFSFTPSGTSQWRKILLNLSAFIGESKVQLAFVGINDWGNNIYLDNIALVTEKTVDVSLLRLISPSVVTCDDQRPAKILIQNAGAVPLTNIDVVYSVNQGPEQILSINDPGLAFGEQKEIELPAINFLEGPNLLTVSLTNPNGEPDADPDDNQNQYSITINKTKDRIPYRENFDGDFSDWTLLNPKDGMNWQPVSTNFSRSLYFQSFDNELIGDEAWLVSPVLDFSRAGEASMLFDVSYATGDISEETLTILASKNCGNTFSEMDYDLPDFASSAESWIPNGPADWKRNVEVDLSSLAGEADVRLAFVVRNQHGNNLYLDNIEFFTTADPDTIEIQNLYSIYGYDFGNPEQTQLKITFNLPERQEVRYTVVSMTGEIETDGILTDVLNQTYPLELSGRLSAGMYFVRVRIGMKYYSSKILIRR